MTTCVNARCTATGRVRLPEGDYCRPHARDLADSLARSVVLARDRNTCQRCGESNLGCQWAHVLARRVAPYLRHDPDNALALCPACHREFTDHPLRFEAWLDYARPGLRQELRDREAEAELAWPDRELGETVTALRAMLLAYHGPPVQEAM